MNQRPRQPRPEPPRPSLRDRLRAGPFRRQHEPVAPARKRRISRREREARQRRQLYAGVAALVVVVLLIFAVAASVQYWFTPRHVLASVGDTKIRREDYWKVRSYNLINQIGLYQQYANLIGGDQAQQYVQMAQQAQSELSSVWGSKSVDADTLNQMVEDQVYLQNMGKLGLSISSTDIKDYILQQFAPQDQPIITPTVTPTLIPQRAAWATQTAEAERTASAGTATVPAGASPLGSPAATPVASPVASPNGPAAANSAASPAASPVASPAASPAVSPTPNPTQARATAQAGFTRYKSAIFSEAHLNESDYERLIVKPAIARQEVSDKIGAQVGQTAEQVHAAHILVTTEDLADKIYQEVTQPGANFAQIAKQQSTDTSTAPDGGDLGWFTRGQMVKPFEDVAFSLKPGEISKPFKTQFGWHIVKVYAHEQNRPMSDTQISALKTYLVTQWVDEQKQHMSISSEVKPTPTAASSQFVPPPGAPTPPPTPTRAPSPGASPSASPAASPVP